MAQRHQEAGSATAVGVTETAAGRQQQVNRAAGKKGYVSQDGNLFGIRPFKIKQKNREWLNQSGGYSNVTAICCMVAHLIGTIAGIIRHNGICAKNYAGKQDPLAQTFQISCSSAAHRRCFQKV